MLSASRGMNNRWKVPLRRRGSDAGSASTDSGSDAALNDTDSESDLSILETLDDDIGAHKDQVDRFRLLIIGKSGCGKTTILSKVCGEEVADKPSTTRGTHNIEREMEFQDNKLFLVHDSEGFEAGQNDEFEVVSKFIKSRSRAANVNDRLHAIWYCLTTSSRPIQSAEEMFFGIKHDVPIVAVFTKFDLFVEDQLRMLMENLDDDMIDEEEEERLEKQAAEIAKQKFEEHYRGALLKQPFPPQTVVTLSDIHTSTPKDDKLTDLIAATTTALQVEARRTGTKEERQGANRLASLFAAAQQADLQAKYRWSIYNATPEFIVMGRARLEASKQRPRLISQWDVKFNANKSLLSAFKTHVEEHPKTYGNSGGRTHRKRSELQRTEIEGCRCLQLVADLTVIMTEVFLLKVKEEAVVLDIIKKYPSTPAFPYIQDEIIKLRLWIGRVTHEPHFQLFRFRNDLRRIIEGAVKISILSRTNM